MAGTSASAMSSGISAATKGAGIKVGTGVLGFLDRSSAAFFLVAMIETSYPLVLLAEDIPSVLASLAEERVAGITS